MLVNNTLILVDTNERLAFNLHSLTLILKTPQIGYELNAINEIAD